jgi:small subunit ribosomal protein S17
MEENIITNEGTNLVNTNESNNLGSGTETTETQVSETAVAEAKSEVSVAETKVEKAEPKVGRRRILEGRVVSNKPNKTIIVLVERYVQHPLYKKYYKRSKKFMAHDEKNECQVGDLVRIMEWRPLSRRKRWMLKEIVERAK